MLEHPGTEGVCRGSRALGTVGLLGGPDGGPEMTTHVPDRQQIEQLAADLSEARERYATLFETMVLGVVYHDAAGVIIAANPHAVTTLGVSREVLVGLRPQDPDWEVFGEDGSLLPVDAHPALVALRTGQVVPDVVMGVRHGTTGERRWLSVTAVPDAFDDHGRAQRVYAMFKDVTEERRATAAARDRETLLSRLRDANVLGIVVSTPDRVVDANEAFLNMVGRSQRDLASGRLDWRAITSPEWALADEDALEQLRRTGACDPYEKEYVHAGGRRVRALVGAAVVDREPLRWVTFVADLSQRERAEAERSALLARAHAAGAEAELAEERLRLLLGAGALVAATRDRSEVLNHLSSLVVPTLADYAAIFLPGEDGRLQVAAVAHHRPGDGPQIARLRGERVAADTLLPLSSPVRSGRSELVDDVDRLAPSWSAADPVIADVVGRIDCGSAMMVPLHNDDESLGVLAMGRSRSRAPFRASDLEFGEELGRRLSVGLGNVEDFAREHGVAEMLQRCVLPAALPQVRGVDLAVRYLPATQGMDVGGDWYDAFPVDENRLALVLGDVLGHNLVSASVMSQLRNAVRAYAIDDPDPASVMMRANAALAALMPDAMATVFYGLLDLATRTLTHVTAGHPPPLLVSGEGCEYVEEPVGLMLGVAPDASYDVGRRVLPETGSLLLYSDGLVEDRSRSLEEGLGMLAAAFAGGVPGGADAMCEQAQSAMLDQAGRADDVCLLAVCLTSSGA